MKSKEIAELLIAGSEQALAGGNRSDGVSRDTTHALINASLQECVKLIREAGASTAGKPAKMTDEILASRLREAFSKWKSVVRHVKASLPDHPIADHMLPSLIALESPASYERLKQLNAFLGYDASSLEKEVQAQNAIDNILRSAVLRMLA